MPSENNQIEAESQVETHREDIRLFAHLIAIEED